MPLHPRAVAVAVSQMEALAALAAAAQIVTVEEQATHHQPVHRKVTMAGRGLPLLALMLVAVVAVLVLLGLLLQQKMVVMAGQERRLLFQVLL
jgi:hypothetical protein